jgi:hypothetical protein
MLGGTWPPLQWWTVIKSYLWFFLETWAVLLHCTDSRPETAKFQSLCPFLLATTVVVPPFMAFGMINRTEANFNIFYVRHFKAAMVPGNLLQYLQDLQARWRMLTHLSLSGYREKTSFLLVTSWFTQVLFVRPASSKFRENACKVLYKNSIYKS